MHTLKYLEDALQQKEQALGVQYISYVRRPRTVKTLEIANLLPILPRPKKSILPLSVIKLLISPVILICLTNIRPSTNTVHSIQMKLHLNRLLV